ncbi:MAG: EF-P lysine aminoacylase GenX [Kiritimatiellaeota bacterium]|nr:EF-P lysine aminoacylase GenX [Kiritimatiellota bacterium]
MFLPLVQRAAIVRAIREFFDARGFIEVETPIRLRAPANEAHINAPPSGDAFLRASPELEMKRLLADGHPRIYQIGACFREGEEGDRHHGEFTMLEWYRAHADYDAILDDFCALVPHCATTLHGTLRWEYQKTLLDLSLPPDVITVHEAYRRWAAWDPVAAYHAERFDMDMALKIEPALPKDRLCILKDYPAGAAALSALHPGNPRLAQRWEGYLGGMELVNAFTELTDPAEQRARFEAAAAERRRMGNVPYPINEAFLASLSRLPPSGGAALGVDRLAMLLLDIPRIRAIRVTDD